MNGVAIRTVRHAECTEFFLSASIKADGAFREALERIAHAVHGTGATVVSQEIFGVSPEIKSHRDLVGRIMGPVRWPVTWVDGSPPHGSHGGIQVWAVKGADLHGIQGEGQVLGCYFDGPGGRFCRLGGLQAESSVTSPEAQTVRVFERMTTALEGAGLSFRHVARTWFYNRDILSWYAGFNKVRTQFFREQGVFDGTVPASTGIGGSRIRSTALTAGAFAIRPSNNETRFSAIPSPLQCPALEYGSSFSRAVEVSCPDHRRLFVSGTASISPEGETQNVGDVRAQIAHTMDVVEAILASRSMGWADVTRSIAYFEHGKDLPHFAAYCARNGLDSMPVVCMSADVCREDLLFEIEVDAIQTSEQV